MTTRNTDDGVPDDYEAPKYLLYTHIATANMYTFCYE